MRRPVSALIIGGGPAGSMAAAILSRGGLEVTLIEQSRFPREKVCGECLSDLGMRALCAAGLEEVPRRLRAVRLTWARVIAPGGRELAVRLPSPMWGMSRGAMDAALLQGAQATCARVLQPARVERLVSGERPGAVVRDLQSNELRRLDADLILLADGKCALLGAKPRATGELGLKAHFEGLHCDPGAISLFGVKGHYAGLAPVSDGQRILWNLAAAVPAARVRAFGGEHEALLTAMRRDNAALDRALADATRISPWLACPLPRFAVWADWPAGIIPLGNAAAALEPIGGEGMGLAIASAALAARFVLEGRTSPADVVELRREYVHLWRRRRTMWRALAMILSRPRLARLGIRAARAAPILAASFATLARPTGDARAGVSCPGASVLS